MSAAAAAPLGALRLQKKYKRHPVGTAVLIVKVIKLRGKISHVDLRLPNGKVLNTVPIEHLTG
jgi:hypothetical protein